MKLTKTQTLRVTYGTTPYICVEDTSSPKRFLLIDTTSGKIVKKSNNPLDFEEVVWKEIK